MSLPKTIDEAIPYRIRKILSAASRASNELICDVVPCWCGAEPGQYCRGTYHPERISKLPHSDRRVAASRWRRKHPKQWKKMRDETFSRIVKETRK